MQQDLLRHVQAACPSSLQECSKRGAVYPDGVSDWPGRKVKSEPEIVPGYAYKAGAPVTLGCIGGDKFNFFSRNEAKSGSAWLLSLNDGGHLLDALEPRRTRPWRWGPPPGAPKRWTPIRWPASATPSPRCTISAKCDGQKPISHGWARDPDRPGSMAAAGGRAGGSRRTPDAKAGARMRTRQLWNWIYVHGARDFGAMTNLAGDFRDTMAGRFHLDRPEIVTEQISEDGTRKWLLRTGPGIEFESVYIPGKKIAARLCVSSQVGCTLTRRFGHPGTQKLGAQSDARRNPVVARF